MPKREILHVTVPLLEFQSSSGDSELGTWKGYANLIGFLENNYGSIFAKGCYVQSIPSFLKNGFVPDSHGAADGFEYTLKGSYGYPTAAREDAKGLYFEGAFHSDEHSQVLRTRIRERADAGLSVGMSIGFLTTKSFRILPKDYKTELPKYLAPAFLQQGLKDAEGWPSIQIRQQVELIENSLTLTPAMSAALVTEIQSMERQGAFLDIDESLALSQVWVVLNSIGYNFGYACFCDELTPLETRRAMWDGVWQDGHDYAMKIFDAYAGSELAEEPGEEAMSATEKTEIAKSFFHSMFADPKVFSPLAGLTLKQSRERALAAVQSYLTRMESLADRRKTDRLSGRAVSKANWEEHKALRDKLDEDLTAYTKECRMSIDEMDKFLEKHDPNTDPEKESRNARIRALRMKALSRKLSEDKS